MSEHMCQECSGRRASIYETKGEIVHLLRIAEQRPGTQQAKVSLARIPVLKKRMLPIQEWLTDHLRGTA